jgi:predicted permease
LRGVSSIQDAGVSAGPRSRLRLLWAVVFERRRFESELDAELEVHRLARSDDLVAQGFEPEAARRIARQELGMTGLHRDDCRRARGLAWIDTRLQDVRYGWRGLWRNPGYSLTALLVLGIAVAANALLFSLFSAYGLRTPPVEHAGRWVTVDATTADNRTLALWGLDEADALVRSPPAPFSVLYSMREVRLPVVAQEMRSVGAEAVTPNYFSALGVGAVQGRVFVDDEGASDRGTIVLSHLGWQRLLGGIDAPVGRRIEIAAREFVVIGVTAPEFTGTTPLSAQFWIREDDFRRLRPAEAGPGLHLEVSGFLHEHATADQGAAALTARALAFNPVRAEEERLARTGVTARSGYLRASDLRDLVVASLPIAVAFALVLLVAAANLANLVLARFAARQRELAVRVSVGAPRRRLVAQLLTECVLLATLSAILGFMLARLAATPMQVFLFGLMGDFGIDLVDIDLGADVFAYGWVLALLAALAFGGLPAWLATGPWKGGTSRPSMAALQRGAGSRLRSVLMVAQIAISVVLLVLASLIAGNARIVERTELGFDPRRVVALHPETPTEALAQSLRALPQVDRVAAASRTPLLGSPQRVAIQVDARSEPLFLRGVDAGFFDVFEIGLLHGRLLQRADEQDARVAVISRRTAQRLWPDQDPIGRVFDVPPQDALGRIAPGRVEVVGVVEDVVSAWFISGIDASAVYLPQAIGSASTRSVLVRLRDTSPQALDTVARACMRTLPEQNCELLPMLTAVKVQRLPFLVASSVAAALGWTALGISCIGLYGLVSYLVLQKRREIGVRLALGARAGRVAREMLGTAARQIALGMMIGMPLALAISRLAASFTDQLRTFDLSSFVLVPAVLGALALIAAWVPARRTAAIAPTEALRED